MYQKFDMTLFNINQIQKKEANLVSQISTGKEFQNLSESPIKANKSLIIRNSLNQVDQYSKNVGDAAGTLSAVESNMASAMDIMQQAREQGLKASSSTYSQENRQSLAKILNENIEQMVTISNNKYLGKQLFSGEQTQTKSFDFDGTAVTYNGDTNVPTISISPNSNVKVTENGQNVFGGAFNALIKLRDDIQSGNIPDIETAIANLDVEMDKFVDLRAEVGVRMESMEMYKGSYAADKLSLQTQQVEVEEVDFTEKFMEYSNTQRIHQGILATTQKMFSISLLNYM